MRVHALDAEWRGIANHLARDSANTPALNSAIVVHMMGNHDLACFCCHSPKRDRLAPDRARPAAA